jgi:tetratricopeptide (TPR) repeat protein
MRLGGWMLLLACMAIALQGMAWADETTLPLPTTTTTTPTAPPSAFSQLSKAEQDNLKEAIVAYNQGLLAFGQAQQAQQQGQLSVAIKGFRSAEGLFKAALKFNPTLVEAQSNLAYVALAQQRYPQAVKAFKQALAMQPKHLASLQGLATAYSLQLPTVLTTPTLSAKQDGLLQQALDVLAQLQEAYPNHALAWYNQGSLYQRVNNLPKAETAYLQALERDPTLQQAWFNLATLYETTQHWGDAQRAYQQAKQTGITTPIGLEALKRLEGLPQRQALTTTPPAATNDTPTP